MNLEDYLAPVNQSLLLGSDYPEQQRVGHSLRIHKELDGVPDLEGVQIALLGVMEDRSSQNPGCAQTPNEVRKYLYTLYWGSWEQQIADLGNIYAGEKVQDTQESLAEVCFQLLKAGIIPLVIGGSQDLTYGTYRAYDRLEQTVNLVAVDPQFDLGKQEDSLHHHSYLSHIILQQPYILFNYSNLGYQTYFVNQEEIDLMDRMYFEVKRLGEVHYHIEEVEPSLRDADLVSFDLGAVRQSDAPGNTFHSPNGFSGEEACAIARYAGISDKVTTMGIYECNPHVDKEGRTPHLVAQMVWYFWEGMAQRKNDYPFASKMDYQRFTVLIQDGEYELIFYKSPWSGRWWIEVSLQDKNGLSRDRHKLVPCSYRDYEEACQNHLPERWWQAMKKGL